MCCPPESVRALWSRSWRSGRIDGSSISRLTAPPDAVKRLLSRVFRRGPLLVIRCASPGGFRRSPSIEVDDGDFLVVDFGGHCFLGDSVRCWQAKTRPGGRRGLCSFSACLGWLTDNLPGSGQGHEWRLRRSIEAEALPSPSCCLLILGYTC